MVLSQRCRPQASPHAPSLAPSMWEDQSSSSLAPGSQPTVELANETTRVRRMVQWSSTVELAANSGARSQVELAPAVELGHEWCNVHFVPRARPADWRRTVFPYQDDGGGYWREVIWITFPSRPWSAPRRCVCWWWQTDDGRWHRAGDYLW